MKNNELKLLWPFYMTALTVSSFSVAVPVWVVFFQKDFSFVQISFALSLHSLAAILFEVPTGAIADIFGRKASVVLGITLQGMLWIALPFIHLEILLYCAYFLMGLLRTLESGADKAWMVDWLKNNHRGDLIQEMFIKIQSLSSIGCVVSSLFASLLLFCFEIRHLFFVQACGYFVEGFVLFFFAKEKLRRVKVIKLNLLFRNAVSTVQNGFSFLLSSKRLLYLILAATCAVCSKDFGCLAWQPLLIDLSLRPEYLGIVFSIASSIGIVAPFLTKTLLKSFKEEQYYLSATTLIEFSFLLSLYFIKSPFLPVGVIVYLFVMFISDIQSPVGSMYFHSLIPNKMRATVGSAQSMIFALFSCVITLIGGYALETKGPKLAIIYFSFLLIPSSILYLSIKNKPDKTLPKPL